MRKKGFTIIELLVVISIIGFLTSIVLVNLNLPFQKYKARVAKGLSFSQSVHNTLGSEAAGIWEFDEGSGLVAKDSSGYGTDGSISGATYTSETPNSVVGSGSGKSALSFNGSTDSVLITTSKIGTEDQLTVAVWVLPYDQPAGGSFGDHNDIVRSGCFGSGEWGISTADSFNSSNQLYLLIGWLTSSVWWVPSSATVNKNQWNHLVLTMDRSNGKAYFYRDGQLISSITPIVGVKPTTSGFRVGVDCAGEFKGIIDEVRIYNQLLTIGEIRRHYAEGLKKYHNLTQK